MRKDQLGNELAVGVRVAYAARTQATLDGDEKVVRLRHGLIEGEKADMLAIRPARHERMRSPRPLQLVYRSPSEVLKVAS